MKKSLLYRLFGAGRLPPSHALEFAAEVVVLSDEGLKATITYRNFHRPGRYSGLRKVGIVASIVLTEKRFAAYRRETPLINVPPSDERLKKMHFSVEPNGALMATFDASLFHDDWAGQIEYRFKTPQASTFVEKLKEMAG